TSAAFIIQCIVTFPHVFDVERRAVYPPRCPAKPCPSRQPARRIDRCWTEPREFPDPFVRSFGLSILRLFTFATILRSQSANTQAPSSLAQHAQSAAVEYPCKPGQKSVVQMDLRCFREVSIRGLLLHFSPDYSSGLCGHQQEPSCRMRV